MKRQNVMEKLVDEHINYILINNPLPADYLFQILNDGFKGYMNMTDDELIVHYREIFSRDIRID